MSGPLVATLQGGFNSFPVISQPVIPHIIHILLLLKFKINCFLVILPMVLL